jgi:hypothetical protein
MHTGVETPVYFSPFGETKLDMPSQSRSAANKRDQEDMFSIIHAPYMFGFQDSRRTIYSATRIWAGGYILPWEHITS